MKTYAPGSEARRPQILHFWAPQGEWPKGAFPAALLNGVAVETQVNVKSHWNDGSIRDAILAFVIPAAPRAGGELTVTFAKQDSCHCEPGTGLSKQQILDSWDFDARQVFAPPPACENCRPEIASARQILERWDGSTGSTTGSMYWLYGSVVTELVLAEHATKKSDAGFRAAPPIRIHAAGAHCESPAIGKDTTQFCVDDASNLASGQFVTIYGLYRAETVRVCSVDAAAKSFQVGSAANCPSVEGRSFGGNLTGQQFKVFAGGLPALTGKWLPARDEKERPLRPWFTARFWPALKSYQVDFHLGNYDSSKLHTQHIGIEYQLGQRQPKQVYRYHVPDSLFTPDHVMARPRTEMSVTRADGKSGECTPQFWSGGYQPGCSSIQYPYEYWGHVVRIIPAYARDFSLRPADIEQRLARYDRPSGTRMVAQRLAAEQRFPWGNGSHLYAMASPGGRDDLGLWPVWCLDALQGYDWRAQNVCTANTWKHHGAFPFFLVEGDANHKAYFNRQVREVLGRPVTIRSRPNYHQIPDWKNEGFTYLSPDPVRGFLRGNTFDFLLDDAHLSEPYSLHYMLTGDYASLRRGWLMGSFLTATGNTSVADHRATGSAGRVSAARFSQVRASGRLLWSLGHISAVSPEGFAETDWLRDTVQEWLAAEAGIYGLTDSAYYRDRQLLSGVPGVTLRQIWDWGRHVVSKHAWGSSAYAPSGLPHPLRYSAMDFYNDPFFNPEQVNRETVHRLNSAWMENFSIIAFGRLVEMGFPDALPLFDWRSRYCIETSRMPLPAAMICGSYRIPTALRTPVTFDPATAKVLHPGHTLKDGELVEFAVGVGGTKGRLPDGVLPERGAKGSYLAFDVEPGVSYRIKDFFTGRPVRFSDPGVAPLWAVVRTRNVEEQLQGYLDSWRKGHMSSWKNCLGSAPGFNDGYCSFQLAVLAQACSFGIDGGCDAYRKLREPYNQYQRPASPRTLSWDWTIPSPGSPKIAALPYSPPQYGEKVYSGALLGSGQYLGHRRWWKQAGMLALGASLGLAILLVWLRGSARRSAASR